MKLLLCLAFVFTGCTQVDLKNGTIKTMGNSQNLSMNYGGNSVHWDSMDHAIVITATGSAVGNVAGTVLTGLTAYHAVTSTLTASRSAAAVLPATTVFTNRHAVRATPTPVPASLRAH